jgi:lysophospholipase L1-like esterase
MRKKTNTIIAILAVLLLASMTVSLNLYRKAKIYNEDALLSFKKDEKMRDDFAKNKTSRAEVYKQFKFDTSDIVFLGNSLTEGFPVNDYFSGYKIKNRGVSGYVSEEVVKLMPIFTNCYPKKIFIEIGINDIKYGLNDKVKMQKAILDNYTTILNTVKQASPRTIVYVQSILPVNKSYNPNDAESINTIVLNINTVLKKLASNFGYTYIDLYPAFSENGALIPKLSTDGIHLNEQGYNLWYSLIKNQVAE